MLTDLHVHLRSDAREATAQSAFTAANAERYAEVASERGIEFLGVSEHVYRFRQALEVWRHPFWEENATDDIDAYCDFVRTDTPLALGIEADFIRGREDGLADLLEERDWDYVLGSVHFVGDGAVDMGGEWDVWRRESDPERVWASYFETLGEAARCGLFDVIAHPDLVKMWGGERPRPARDPRFHYQLAMDGIAESDVAIEVSTAGLRKPAAEIYPAPAFLSMCLEAGRPVTLSSDAHTPNDLGYRYEEAVDLLRSMGVEEVAVFEGRRRRLVSLG